MLSFWHIHALDYLKEAQDNSATEVVAVWDEEFQRGRTIAAGLGVPFYEQLDELLTQPDIDGVIVDTPTTMHHSVLIAAAQAGKHIFTEKVIAPTQRECQEILSAVDKASVKLTVSLPRLNASSTQAIERILQQDLLGELTLVRTRWSHNGAVRTPENAEGWLPAHFFNLAETSGGAMIDLGCHPMYLARLFLGMPESVSANYGYITGRDVEDNAVAILRYPQGTIGVIEAGFVNRFSPFTIEIHGTEGSLFYGTPEEKLYIRSALLENGDMWVTQDDFPVEHPSAFEQWVTHIQQGTTATENIQIASDLSTLMDAANLSAKRNEVVRLVSQVKKDSRT